MFRQAENELPAVLDGLAFAGEGGVIAGLVPIPAMPRLAEMLASPEGRLECRIEGQRDGEGKSWLKLGISGEVSLVCQRCLSALAWPLRLESRLLLVAPGQAWPEDELVEDSFDAIPAEKEMALLPLIEEEVLLALPIAPRHETCGPSAPVVVENEPSPFAALAKLKKGV